MAIQAPALTGLGTVSQRGPQSFLSSVGGTSGTDVLREGNPAGTVPGEGCDVSGPCRREARRAPFRLGWQELVRSGESERGKSFRRHSRAIS